MNSFYVVGLLVVIAISEISRLYLTHRTHTKKDHYKQKLDGVMKMIWDQEFKLFKTKEIREGVRQSYEQTKARISVIDEQLTNWPKDKPVVDKPGMEDEKVRMAESLKKFEENMKNLDIEIEGSKPTNELPEGHQGIKMQIDSLMELKAMLDEHIKSI